jgi:hypothetical protein
VELVVVAETEQQGLAEAEEGVAELLPSMPESLSTMVPFAPKVALEEMLPEPMVVEVLVVEGEPSCWYTARRVPHSGRLMLLVVREAL